MASRTRCYCAIGYPESLADNWQEILQETHVQVLISPLHDKDKTEEGELKKEHFHIMLLFDGVKTMQQAQKIFDDIKATQCIAVNSVRGQARYLCHLDDLDKEPYDTGNVVALNGADYFSLIELPSNKYQVVRDIIYYCTENNITSFAELLEYSSLNNEVWFRSLCDNSAYIVKEYLKSKLWTLERHNTRNYSSNRKHEYEE